MINVNDMVRIIASFPNGAIENVFGETGRVIEIKSGGLFRVLTKHNAYLFDASQIVKV